MSNMTPNEILKKYWGFDTFRPIQDEIIQNALSGKDVLALMPTGGGKSICFQVPAMLMDGMCLVISPLIALMQDQIEKLNDINIPAKAVTAGMGMREVDEIMNACEDNEIKFLYISPERLKSQAFLERIGDFPIALLAIDEAHCISQWGYDFRPAYLKISKIKQYLKNVPTIALTASATPIVKADIAEKLELNNPAIFQSSFSRKNLSYHALKADDKMNTLIRLLKETSGISIVYCKTRRKTKEISELLNQFQIHADYYHAGIASEERKERQKKWIQNKIECMVCTNAFGMGIDKPDVRLVIHFDAPDCLENYYQEAGRAGRDGEMAKAILLYRDQDVEELNKLPDIKFPSIDTIRKVYKALGNYFQLPAGAGMNMHFDFDISSFLSYFKLNLNDVLYSLDTLKQEEIIDYQDQVFTPSTVFFQCNRDTLEMFQTDFPASEPLIKALLRTYGGIFDVATKINERQIAWLLKKDIGYVRTELQKLHNHKILNYTPSKESAQIVFLTDRIISDELNINYAFYEKRKKEYTNRINSFIGYIKSKTCRSVLISNYFGDLSEHRCGQCDNCQSNQPISIDRDLTLELVKKIKTQLQKIGRAHV